MTFTDRGIPFVRIIGVASLILVVVAASSFVFRATATAQDSIESGFVATEDTRLNLRAGPGTEFAIVDKLDPGAAVTVQNASEDGLWLELEAVDDGVTGWAASEFIAAQASPQGEATAEGDSDPERTLPAFGPRFIPAQISRSLSSAATIVEDEDPPESESDVSVQDEGADGEAKAAAFVFPVPTPDPDAVVESAATTDTGDAADDETVDLTNAVAVDEEPEPVATPRPAPGVPTAITQPDRMNVRAGPGTVYAIVTSVPAGTEMEIVALGPLGEWYQVKLDGQEEPAWVFAGLADTLGPMDALARVAEEDVPPPPEPAPAVAASAAPSAAVAAAPPPSGAGFFGYGIQAHLLGGQAGSAMTSISDLGFNWVKQQVQWKDYQPQAGAVGFGELGGIVSAAQGRGINVLFSVVNAPQWAREPGFDNSVGGPPADPQTYANFVGAMAGQFCGTSLKAIEIWNEQNLHYEWGNKPLNPVEYMNLLKPAYAAIKAACPEMLVISGALTPAASNGSFAMDDFAYLEGMYQNGLAQYSDGIGAHPSGYNVPASVRWEEACGVIQQTGNIFNGACDTPHHSWAFRSTMEGYRNIMTVYGDTNKRIWPTEFGWAAGGAFDPRYAYANDNSFDEQAKWTVEAYQMMRDWGWVGPAFLWNLNFRVVADGTEKAQWGIVGNDWQPLPTYQALQAMPK